jgi:hypothetical protein
VAFTNAAFVCQGRCRSIHLFSSTLHICKKLPRQKLRTVSRAFHLPAFPRETQVAGRSGPMDQWGPCGPWDPCSHVVHGPMNIWANGLIGPIGRIPWRSWVVYFNFAGPGRLLPQGRKSHQIKVQHMTCHALHNYFGGSGGRSPPVKKKF